MDKFQCIFCGETIDKKKEKITSLLITSNWKNEDEQSDQQVFCHMSCLKERCHIPESIYVDEN